MTPRPSAAPRAATPAVTPVLLPTSLAPRRRRPAGRALAALLVPLLAGVAGCNFDETLAAPDPDIIPPDALDASATTALTLKNGVNVRLVQGTSGQINDADNIFLFGGLLADEWRSSDTFEQRNTVDQRVPVQENSFLTSQYRSLNRVRIEGDAAIGGLRAAGASVPSFHVGEVFAWQSLALNLMGEHFCNGVILSSLQGSDEVFGNPIAVDSVFRLAAGRADSALANVAGTGGANVRNLAAVQKGRALLNRGQFAEAAAAVADVPTTFRYWTRHSLLSQSNQLWALNVNVTRYSMGDREGGNGLPFRTAADPRVPFTAPAGRLGFDSQTPWVGQTRWGRTDSVMVASGIEARLIQAEAALRAGSPTWLDQLNNPRVPANGSVAGLTPLTDPGSADARLDLVMRERAFWMFSTGHRLGDLRRLVRQYGRDSEAVFPTGTFAKGGSYGNAVNLPLPITEQNNPNFRGCSDRRA